MKAKKRNLIAIAVLVLAILCAGVVAGVRYFNNNHSEPVQKVEKDTSSKRPETTKIRYTLSVKDKAGNPVKGALVAFYDENNNMIDVPVATNSVGSAIYTVKEKGSYGAGLVSVPFRYALDSEIKTFEGDNTKISIVLEDNPNAYVAQIGDQKYVFEDAITYANDSEEDVTITLLGDLHFAAVTINNKAGKKITVDGNGHTITTISGGNAININQKTGIVEFKNMIIDHKNLGQIFKAHYGMTLNLKNMKLIATHDQKDAYKYCLINFMGEGTSNLYMEKVDVVLATTSKGSSAEIIRTGNSDTPKHVNITLKNCNLDSTGASGRAGIMVMDNCTSDIKISGTTIMTKDTYAIRPNGQKLSYTADCKFGSKHEWYNAHPIEQSNAMIGDKRYTFVKAIKVANESTEDVTIKLVGEEGVCYNQAIKNVNGKNITIDGGGNTLYLGGSGHALFVNQTSGTVTFKNMNIEHTGSGMLMRIGENRETDNSSEKLTVNLSNVDIKSTSDYKYCLIGTQDYKTFNVNMKDVNVDWDKANDYSGSAFVRAGAGSTYAQQLNLTMEDCVVDVSGAEKTQGFYIVKKVQGTIDLINTTIITDGADPYTNTGSIQIKADEKCEFNTNSGEPVAKIGDEVYLSLQRAVAVANAATKDVVIELIDDVYVMGNIVLDNTNGKNVTIDGAKHTLKFKSAGNMNHSIKIHQTSGNVTLQNMDIVHSGDQMLLRLGEDLYSESRNLKVKLSDMNITSTTTYKWCLMGTQDLGQFDIEMTNVDVDWNDQKNTQSARAFLRCGNGKDKQIVNLTANECNINLSDAVKTQGMYICKDVSGEVHLNNSDIITDNEKIFTNSGTVKVFVDTDLVTTYEVSTKDELIAALDTTQKSVRNAIIKLMDDIEVDESLTIDANGVEVTVDGANDDERHTLTISSTGAGNHTIKIHQTSGNITFQNLKVVHGGDQMLLRLGEGKYVAGTERALGVVMENVDITSTSTYPWCLVATQDLGQFDIEMTNVDVDWNDQNNTQAARAFLRCGDGKNNQTVNLTTTGCTINVADAAKTQGMNILAKVSGTFEFKDTDIITSGASIYTNSGNVQFDVDDDCEFSTNAGLPVAMIGEQAYLSFAKALEAANASTDDVTIELTADIALNDSITINNTNGNNITIDGTNGEDRYTLTITSTGNGNPSIKLHQISGNVTFQNLNIVHGGDQMLLRLGENTYTTGTERTLTVNLTNMDIKSSSTYAYCLMGTQALGQFDIEMTKVNVDWNGNNTYSSQRAFLRCGKDAQTPQTVNLTATGCTIDVADTTNTQGMYICAGVSGAFDLVGTDIIIPAAATAMHTNKGSVTVTYIVNSAEEFITAVSNANASAGDVMIKLLADITLTDSITIDNLNGNDITIDGAKDDARQTLTITSTGAGNHSIKVHQRSGNITFQNLNIVHGGDQMLLRMGEDKYDAGTERTLGVTLENVDITSTSTYKWCLMATQALGQFDIEMTNVDVNWNGDSNNTARAFLRSGKDANNTQTVNLTATGCTIDVSATTNTQGMYICAGVSGAFDLVGTDIVIPAAATAKYTKSSSATATITSDADCAFTRVYKVANAGEFTTALTNANASAEAAIIKLAADITLTDSITINNTNGKNIMIDGAKDDARHTLTISSTGAGNHSIKVHQRSGNITFQNLNIVHGGDQMMLRMGEDKYDAGTERTLGVTLENVDITSTSTYKWCLMATQALGQFDIEMTNVDVNWNGDSNNTARAFLRSGKDANNIQTVNLTATGCTIDVSATTNTQGMYICAGVSGAFDLVGTDIVIPAAATAKYTKSSSATATITSDADCAFTRVYQVANAGEFTTALTNANTSAEAAIIKLAADITLTDSITINNTNGKNIMIDGAKDDARQTLTITSTGAGNHSIKVHQRSGNITFQNLNIVHGGDQMLLRMGEDKYDAGTERTLGVTLENMDITSTSTYKWCLMATQALGQFDIEMTNVDVDWNGDSNNTARAFLRCGKDANNTQTVNLTATGCTVDVADTTNTQGMYICAGVSGKFELTNSSLLTKSGIAPYTNKAGNSVTISEVSNDEVAEPTTVAMLLRRFLGIESI